MESLHTGVTETDKTIGIVVPDDEAPDKAGIEEFITSDVVLGLLGIPETGLLRISAALLIAGNNEVCAYWWRDQFSGQQHAELRDPVFVRAAFSTASIDSGYLPQGVIRLGISQNTQWMALALPPRLYQLTLVGEEQQTTVITVRLPGFVLTGYSTSYWIWAVKDDPVSAHTMVYHMPLPNIGEDGTLCFGTNRPPKADGPTIMQALQLFFDSPFNDHWAIGKARSLPGADIRPFLQEIAAREQPIFPEEELVPITPSNDPKQALTLDDLLQHVLRKKRV